MNRLARGLAWAALVLAPSLADALDPKRALTQYVRQTWQIANGLPSSIVYSITQTADGGLWVATSAGVARFDGSAFEVFDHRSAGLPSNTVWAIAADPDGSLWAGTTEGLAHLIDGRATNYSVKDGLTDRFVQVLLRDRRGRLWIGTSHGLSVREGDRIRAVTDRSPFAKDPVDCLFEDAEGRVWAGGKSALASFDANLGMTLYGAEQGVPEGRVKTIWERDGRVWFASDGLRAIENGRAIKRENAEYLMTALTDRDGNLWLGSARHGLSRLRDGRAESLTTDNGLVSNWIQALYEDREGSLWVGLVSGGLVRLRAGKAVTFGVAEGLPHDRVTEIVEDREGRIWTITNRGIARYANGRWETVQTPPGKDPGVLLADPDSGVWTTWEEEGTLQRLGGATSRLERIPASGEPWAIENARGGGFWIAGQNGLFRFLNGKESPAGVNETVSTLLEETDGSLWIGTPADGLRRLRDGVVTSITSRDGLPSNSIHRLHRDASGALWFGTPDAGLVRFKDGRFRAFGAREGLADSVCAVIEDDAGYFWVTSLRGIFRVAPQQFADVADGRADVINATALDEWDGLRSAECRRGALRARDGRLWFGTTLGISLVDPTAFSTNSTAPAVSISRVAVDGNDVHARPTAPLSAGTESVVFGYAAATLADPRRIRFRIRLDGYDRDWIDVGQRRTAEYRKLPHGDYTFRVVASSDDGVWGKTPTTLAFSVAPYVHETWWARALLGLSAIGLISFGAGLRVRTLRRRATELEKRQVELERVVGERTEELRGTVSELQRAQDQLARLSAATPEKLENVAAWADSMAREIARTIGAKQIGIWSLHGSEMRPVVTGTTLEPDIEDLRSAIGGVPSREIADTRVIPVPGMSGELRGGLVIEGAARWGEMEQRLVAGFAQHLGSALDLRRLREQLTQTEERQAATRQRMREEGIAAVLICPVCRRCFQEGVARCDKDDSALDDSLLLPFRLEHRYRLSSLLGQGGMGSVFRAEDEKLGRPVAIKLIRAERLADSVIRFRFEREAHTLAQLRHPSVAALFDSGELADGSAFLVMELLSGPDLAQILGKHGPGSPVEVARLIQQAGAGLSAVHRAGVVHRDVKPANLILAGDPSGFETKVVDFGLAAAGQIDARVTHAGTVLGTPAYMSPEQAQGLGVDARADLYSLAAVGYEALTGTRAVSGNDLGALVEVLYTVPPLVSSRLPWATPELDEAFASALAKQPDDRPASVEIWARAVAEILERTGPVTPKRWPDVAS